MAKKILVGLAVFVGLVVLAAVSWKVYLDATYFKGYDPKAPLNAQVRETVDTPYCTRVSLFYDGMDGQRVPTWLELPKEGKWPFPCIVFLHGIGDDKEFMAHYHLDETFMKAGFAFVTFDQLMQGERKLRHASGLQQAATFRVRAAHTVNDTRRLIDYLQTRPDIARDRIYLCGASYGAITGATATAFDPRIRAAVLTYGGGNLRKLLSADLIREEIGAWRFAAYAVAWYFGGVFDPVRYVGRISPRPVLLQNGLADTIVSPAAGKALQEAAREPKRIMWYEGDHLGKTSDLDIPLTMKVLGDALTFLSEQDAKRGRTSP
ncbi:MAG: acetylxylan esterase [Candidatus Hydrogenedentes bacterium]|nr:acetylxylan esterase [Candidatus Hydrogenedentota bacterium]